MKTSKPPREYKIILSGNVRKSDLCWGADSNSWGHPTNTDYEGVGSDVKSYWSVASKL